MSVHPLRPSPPPMARPLTFDPVVQGLLLAARLCTDHSIPEDVHVHVHGGGRNVTLDVSYCSQPATTMTYLAAALELSLDERPAETPDGCAAQELRVAQLRDGVLLTIRATIPIPAVWPVQ